MTVKPLVIFGVGDMSEIATYYFEQLGNRQIAAFTVDGNMLAMSNFLGRPVVAFDEIEAHYPPTSYDMFVAIGYSKVNGVRKHKCTDALSKGYALASYISPLAHVFDKISYGWNCFIFEGCIVQPFCRIGNGVILRSGSLVAHHCEIGDFAFIAAKVAIAGKTKIGERSFIGVNSTINDHIVVGSRAVVGSGCIVNRDVPDDAVMRAQPATLAPMRSSELKSF
jgi:sugar O-acyltransferase (sialic acid O-acetyltransferase NeuD family)